MPVYGDPSATPATTTKVPGVTRLYDIPVPAKQRSIAIRKAQCIVARIQITDEDGDATDLSDYTAANFTPTIAIKEALTPATEAPTVLLASLVSPYDEGYIEATVPASVADKPGAYIVEASITDDTLYPRAVGTETIASVTTSDTQLTIVTTPSGGGSRTYLYPVNSVPVGGVGYALTAGQQLVRNACLVFSTQTYLLVERGLFGLLVDQKHGPPTRAEVRLHLRDFPEANLLLDEYEFDDAELAQAMTWAVDYWNTVPPPLGADYNTTSFPYRWLWVEGILHFLFLTAAHWHRRNRLPYSAGGVTINDNDKEPQYLQAAQFHLKRFEDQVRMAKVRTNMDAFIGSVRSDYILRRY